MFTTNEKLLTATEGKNLGKCVVKDIHLKKNEQDISI